MSEQDKTMTQRLTDVVTAADSLTQTVQNQIGQINSTVSAKMSEVDSAVTQANQDIDKAILELGNSHANQVISYYDRIQHSKASLAPEIDPQDETQTKWQKVPVTNKGYHIYPRPLALTKVHTINAYRSYPGYYESPEKYVNDWSVTYIEFIVANSEATSEQIDQEIAARNLTVHNVGSWSSCARVYDTNAIKIAGLHPYSQLFVRFKNYVVPDKRAEGVEPQNILEFGGNSYFSIDRVVNYPGIDA
ncbi:MULTISPECIES: hypothetical protein [Pseudoalteromonas]|uniref:Uncharacterized protein n=1 Tax=Pseudoalteromonas amylolytica TaxID=1859457 RepID=A0A1S1MWM0_9GAMM|nr:MULTISPECIES: hypothetical protein [Pseudoalteromonas]OHU87838.1 hypothetical protein BFC16_10520 [Pseudoalteromonas sp. JW3]OHU91278.1 hypothetical protein BET10_10640 [Pseudoalteromonas amylolytica]